MVLPSLACMWLQVVRQGDPIQPVLRVSLLLTLINLTRFQLKNPRQGVVAVVR